MKYLRKFDTVSDMETAIASSEIGIIALAYDGTTPVVKKKDTPLDPKTIPFYVENISNENETLNISGGNYAPTITIEYSTDKTNWDILGTTSKTALTRTIAPGEKVYLRCNTNTWGDIYGNNSIKGVSKVGGNIMSLIYGSSFTGQETSFPRGSTYNFSSLFGWNNNLVNSSELLLPATTLTESCYDKMFKLCSSLTTGPSILPATTLAQHCYTGMFYSDANLVSAPALPATTLANNCYSDMFMGCTSLTTAPELPATILAQSCYVNMFHDCTALITSPELPATTLAQSCYEEMFYNCTNLNYIKCLATDISASSCTTNWTKGVSSTGTFVKNPSMSGWKTGANGIPSGWTVQDATE